MISILFSFLLFSSFHAQADGLDDLDESVKKGLPDSPIIDHQSAREMAEALDASGSGGFRVAVAKANRMSLASRAHERKSKTYSDQLNSEVRGIRTLAQI